MKSTNIRTALAALAGLASGLALSVGGAAFAHGGRGPHGMKWTPEKMEAHLTEMVEKLGLSETQQTKVKEIFDDAKTQAQALEDQPFSREKMLALRDIHFETEDALNATLSCEQRESLRILKREHRAQRMEEHWARHADRH